MDIYLSAGPAAIAARMAMDRTRLDRPDLSAMLQIAHGAGQFTRRCERAVVSTYAELLLHGTGDAAARRASAGVYRRHHPEASPAQVCRLVDGWIEQHCGCAPERTDLSW